MVIFSLVCICYLFPTLEAAAMSAGRALVNARSVSERHPSDLFCGHFPICIRNETAAAGSDEERCLEAHNYYRCLHGAPAVQYGKNLERSAQVYAGKLVSNIKPGDESMKHSVRGQDRGVDVGENLAWRFEQNNNYGVARAISDWYSEVMEYKFDAPGYYSKTGHFTQLVWKATTHIGCAVAKKGYESYVVVHYQSKGNELNQFVNNVHKPIEEVCEARCGLGVCQANGCQKLCKCGNNEIYKHEYPQCHGPCVAFCPRPADHLGYWEERCEGQFSCTCNRERGKERRTVWPGAQCA